MKRHRARLRPRVRERRRSALGSFAALAGVAAGLLLILHAKPWARLKLPAPPSLSAPRWAGVETVALEGAPAALEAGLRTELGWKEGVRWGPLEPGRAAQRLRKAYPCLREVRVRRSWAGRSAAFAVALREPVAVQTEGGRRALYLGRDGTLFPAPEGVYTDPLPALEWKTPVEGPELRELARMLAAAALPGALPVRWTRLERGPDEDGWSGRTEDGAELFWGRLEWTDEKIARLKEVYDDALPRFGALASADLRHFAEGKIIVRPR